MQVPGDLAGGGNERRLVAEGEAGIVQFVSGLTGQVDGAVRIVVAVDPDPVAAAREFGNLRTEDIRQMGRADAVVEIVAEADNDGGIVPRDDGFQHLERGERIVGRQHHAAAREGGALLQMQVGDDEQTGFRQVERAERIAYGLDAGNDGAGTGGAEILYVH
jgi:hypothetical protein